MLKLWVTDPVLISVTREIAEPSTVTAKFVPTVTIAGACLICGRGAIAPAAVNK